MKFKAQMISGSSSANYPYEDHIQMIWTHGEHYLEAMSPVYAGFRGWLLMARVAKKEFKQYLDGLGIK